MSVLGIESLGHRSDTCTSQPGENVDEASSDHSGTLSQHPGRK